MIQCNVTYNVKYGVKSIPSGRGQSSDAYMATKLYTHLESNVAGIEAARYLY